MGDNQRWMVPKVNLTPKDIPLVYSFHETTASVTIICATKTITPLVLVYQEPQENYKM